MKDIFRRYPELAALRRIASDDAIEREVAIHADVYDEALASAEKHIETVNLNKLFPAELERGRITLENFLGHWGNVSVEELCKMCLVIKYIRPSRILEIGTFNGMTTLQMALNAPEDCTTYTLDLPDNVEPRHDLTEIDVQVSKVLREKFGTTRGSYFAGRKDLKIVQLLGDSATFDYSVIDGPLDIVFIDAGHDYENVRADSENAFRLLSPNGVIFWHNYHEVFCSGVTQYLSELAPSKKLFHLRNTCLAIHWNRA